ncbi:gamma carbonic anhydrase family protein [Clostridium sp. cel8]|jgi:carbonic anhydrase/acetyltransferase-like protein (isoleucine patch superfamily)|uniref:gamma carbonic anhydrase family protein n=1 Tax=unclassified Clostridium TaxID=2614128 RepID=UPI0015F59368|nr:gamma carbonic anhydrase family protein [Clostridium sp. cel8]MBA5850082.1 gamma carbonic anhydrase family protein [Clostridium sp. cel8]
MIRKYEFHVPEIEDTCFIADNADVIGKVKIKQDASIWFHSVLRGDSGSIYIGEKTNIQDNCVLHTEEDSPIHIGKSVTVGHNSIIHGCEIGDYCIIGMGSIIMNGSVIGKNTIIGAGSIVTENKNIPSGVLCFGSPAKVIRKLTEEEIEDIKNSAKEYVVESKKYDEYNINK